MGRGTDRGPGVEFVVVQKLSAWPARLHHPRSLLLFPEEEAVTAHTLSPSLCRTSRSLPRMRWRKDQEPWFYFLVIAGRLWKIIFLPELETGPTVRTPSSLKCSNSEREMVTVTEGCLFRVGRKTRKGQLLGYSLENVRKARSTGKFIYIFIYTYTNM